MQFRLKVQPCTFFKLFQKLVRNQQGNTLHTQSKIKEEKSLINQFKCITRWCKMLQYCVMNPG